MKAGQDHLITAILVGLVLCLDSARAYAETRIQGGNDEIRDNIQLMLSLNQENCQAPEWKIRHLFEQSDQEITEALHALGYYQAELASKKLSQNKDCWQADFAIKPGQRMHVKNLDIQINGAAKQDKHFIRLLKHLPLKPGSPLNHAQYESIKSKIESLAQELGYLRGHFSGHQLLIDKQNNSADIHLVYEAGKRLSFGNVRVEQNILDPGLVNKYLTVKNGDFYSSAALAASHNALSQSGYFDTIDIQPDFANLEHNDQIPVNLTLTAKKRHHYGFGAGFDTDIGPLLNGTYLNRRINRLGHFLTANLDLSPVLSTADAEYTIPLDNPSSEFFSIGGGLKREHTDTYQSMAATLSARLKHAFASGWKQTLFIDYSYEDFKTGTEAGRTLLLAPGGNWLQSVSNNLLRPTYGHRLEFESKGSIKNPISDISFLQADFSLVWIGKLPYRGKWIARAEQGATLVDGFAELPTTYRFYAGGITSVRGYAYKELGPKSSDGSVVGGRFLSVASLEYEKALLDNWGIAAFFDTGNAYNGINGLQLKSGTGLGVRWYSPIGPIRIDFALPLNPSDSTFQIHFAAGTRL